MLRCRFSIADRRALWSTVRRTLKPALRRANTSARSLSPGIPPAALPPAPLELPKFHVVAGAGAGAAAPAPDAAAASNDANMMMVEVGLG